MNVSKLLRFLLTGCYSMGIVDGGAGGGAAANDADQADDSQDEQQADDDAADADTQAADDGAGDAAKAEVDADDAEPDEITVSIGDEPEPEDAEDKRAPEWVRELRKSNREKDRRIRELEAKVGAVATAPQSVVVGEKPTLEGCDYDAEKFEQQLEAWHARKLEADAHKRQQQQAEEQQRAHWQTRIDSVKTAAEGLKVTDYEDAAQSFEDTFSLVQQGIVIGGPEDPKSSALLRYALGKNPKKAKELAAIKDPVKFAFAVAKLETQLKITPRKSAPPPDRQVRSAVAGAAAVDNHLARLREEAEKTGDMSKVIAYKRQNKAKQAA